MYAYAMIRFMVSTHNPRFNALSHCMEDPSDFIKEYNISFPWGELRIQNDNHSCGINLMWAAWMFCSLQQKYHVDRLTKAVKRMAVSTLTLNNPLTRPRNRKIFAMFRLWIAISIMNNQISSSLDLDDAIALSSWEQDTEGEDDLLNDTTVIEEGVCPVCTEPYDTSDSSRGRRVDNLSCSHSVCYNCCMTMVTSPHITRSMRLQRAMLCPICGAWGIWRCNHTSIQVPRVRVYGYRRTIINRLERVVAIRSLSEWNKACAKHDDEEAQNWMIGDHEDEQTEGSTKDDPIILDSFEDDTVIHDTNPVEDDPDDEDQPRICPVCRDDVDVEEKKDNKLERREVVINRSCGHFMCLPCFEAYDNTDNLPWGEFTNVFQARKCVQCRRINGTWYKERANVDVTPHIYGYRKLFENDDDTRNFTVQTIYDYNDWRQVCIQVSAPIPWYSGDTFPST